jgi:uroporphyrinogen-III synthase
VYELYEVHPGPSWEALAPAAAASSSAAAAAAAAAAIGNRHISRVVVIGRRLDRQQLEEGVRRCVVAERPEGAGIPGASDA